MSFKSYRKSLDKNQKLIVDEFKKYGCSVMEINGTIDLLVGITGHNLLVEVKNPEGKNKLTKSQEEFILTWKGQLAVVRTVEDVKELILKYI